MASVQELIAAVQMAQEANRPFKGLVDIYDTYKNSYDQGMQRKDKRLDTTTKLIQQDKLRMESDQLRMENEYMRAQAEKRRQEEEARAAEAARRQAEAQAVADATEAQNGKNFAGVGGKTAKPAVLPAQKLANEIEDTNEEITTSTDYKGHTTTTRKTKAPKDVTYSKFDYSDEKGVARTGFVSSDGKFIKSPDDPFVPVARNSESDPIKKAKDLRNEFTDLSKDFFKVNEAVARVRASASDPSAAGDLALIFNYMKTLDPGSTVREGEFATAQNSASIPERLRAQYNKVISGERLSTETRNDFVSRAEMLFEEQRAVHGMREKEYRRLADSVGADPEQVIVNPILGKAPAKGGQPPAVGGVFNGEKILKVERID